MYQKKNKTWLYTPSHISLQRFVYTEGCDRIRDENHDCTRDKKPSDQHVQPDSVIGNQSENKRE